MPTEPEKATHALILWALQISVLLVLNQKRDKVKVQFKQLIQEQEFASPIDDFSQLEQRLNSVLDDNAQNLIQNFWHGILRCKIPASAGTFKAGRI